MSDPLAAGVYQFNKELHGTDPKIYWQIVRSLCVSSMRNPCKIVSSFDVNEFCLEALDLFEKASRGPYKPYDREMNREQILEILFPNVKMKARVFGGPGKVTRILFYNEERLQLFVQALHDVGGKDLWEPYGDEDTLLQLASVWITGRPPVEEAIIAILFGSTNLCKNQEPEGSNPNMHENNSTLIDQSNETLRGVYQLFISYVYSAECEGANSGSFLFGQRKKKKRTRRRKVHFGSRGGRYIIKNGRKKYLQ